MLAGHTEGLPEDLTRLSTTDLLCDYAPRLIQQWMALRFQEAQPPTDDEMDRLLGMIDRRVHRLLARRGVL